MSSATQPAREEPLARRLGVVGVWLLVVNGMIGAGIFGLPGQAAALAGAFSPAIFVLCALLILPIMLSFAELASRFDGTGGPVRYAGSVFGPFVGFQVGWAFSIARLTAFSANAVLLVEALGILAPGLDAPGARLALLVVICGGLTLVTALGTRDAMRSLGILTLLKFLPLLAVVAVALVVMPATMLGAPALRPPPDADLGAAVILVLYAFVGFESGLVPAGEARRPRRDIPRALVAAIAIVAALYVLLQCASLAALPDLATIERPLVALGEALLGPAGALLMLAGMAVSIGGNLAGSIFSTPRVLYALARDRQLPSLFAIVPARTGTPAWSIVAFGAAAFALAAYGSFAWLAAASVLTRLLIYFVCVAAIPALRRRDPDEPDTIRLPGGLLIPGLALLICIGLLTQVKSAVYLPTAALLATGTALYLLAKARP